MRWLGQEQWGRLKKVREGSSCDTPGWCVAETGHLDPVKRRTMLLGNIGMTTIREIKRQSPAY